jgi:membrane-associated phospholipid phosphatase
VLSLALVGCWYVAFHDVALARADAHAYFAFYSLTLNHPELAYLAHRVANLCLPSPYVYLAAGPVIVALLRRRWALAVGLLVMIPASVETSELLKPLLAAPRPALGVANTPLGRQGSWPSGHSTAAMILAMSCLLASPARWRPYVAAAGTLFSLAVIYSVLSLGWHYPSDALGGILVASIWTLVTVAAVLRVDARYGRDLSLLSVEPGRWLGHLPSVPSMLAAAAISAGIAFSARGSQAISFAGHHRSFVLALVAIAALAAFVLAVMTRALSGSDPAATTAHRVRLRRG